MSPLVAPLLANRSNTPAVRAGRTTLTYRDLNDRLAAASEALRRAGIGPGTRVAFALPKSLNSLLVLLATLAVGAAYVPLNPSLSPAALATILADLRPDLLIAPPASLADETHRLPGLLTTSDIGTSPNRLPGRTETVAQPPSLAAILFTSGSTGAPKGIMLSHANIATFSSWAAAEFDLAAADQVASHAPFHFDLSTFDIFATFANGACLHLLGDTDAKFPGAVRAFIAGAGITVWYSVPTALIQLDTRGALSNLASLRHILFAGEVFPTPALRRIMSTLPATQFANLFGPTETNVCTFHRLAAPPASDEEPIPIGRPCPHVDITLDDDGEILAAGPGVMLGYWRQPALTAASRVDSRPDSYRTGDLAHLRGDGILMFDGRRDQQIKRHGHRIELPAIEAVLQSHPAIAEAVALAAGDRLVAYIVENTPIPDPDVKKIIAARLAPSYQPTDIIRVSSLPRGANGKTDRGALRQLLADHGVTI